MYNTADNMEDLNVVEELSSYDTVCYVSENHEIHEEEYKDADFKILVTDFSEIEKLKELLLPFGYKAYLDNGKNVIKLWGF